MWLRLQGRGWETGCRLKQVSCFRAASGSGAFSSAQGPQRLTLGSGKAIQCFSHKVKVLPTVPWGSRLIERQWGGMRQTDRRGF